MKGDKRSRTERGIALITALVFGAIACAGIYTAYKVIPFYYYYYDLKNQFEQLIKVAPVETDEEIRRKALTWLKKYDIPCEPDDLRIERQGDAMTISLKYQEVFFVTWQGKDYDIYTFDFDATTTRNFR